MKRDSLRPAILTLCALATAFLLIWLLPTPPALRKITIFLPIHMTLEGFSIVVSMLVFAVAWNAYSRERPGNVIIIACAMLAVGLIDFLHTLSYPGMPELVTPSGNEKAIFFWLVARLIAALALLCVVLRPWTSSSAPLRRHGMLGAALAITALVCWVGLYHLDTLPRTFIAGQGLTPFKIASEYLLVALLLVPALVFYRDARRGAAYDATALFTAVAVSILSELCLTLYKESGEIFNLLGHIYKVIAYLYIYRALFVASVRQPFDLLQQEATLRKEAEQEARAASRYARGLIEASPDPLVTISPQGTITDVNAATVKVTGVPRENLIGTDFSDYFTEPQKARDGYREVFEKGFVTDFSLTIRHRNRKLTDVLYNATVFHNETGELQGVFAAARDITERKRVETSLAQQGALLEGINQILHEAIRCETEAELAIKCLAVAEKLTGSRFGFVDKLNAAGTVDTYAMTDPGWDACRMPKTDAVRLLKGLPLRGIWAATVKTGEPVIANDVASHPDRVGTPPGHPPLLRFLGVPLKMEGKPIGSIGLGNKPSDYGLEDQHAVESLAATLVEALLRKRAEEEIHKINAELEQRVAERTVQLEAANKELEAFAYSASHDLRAPLRAVDGFSRALLEDYSDKLDAEGQDYLQRLRAAAQHMAGLVDDLLRLSRITRADMASEPVDLGELARAAADELRTQEPAREVVFEIAAGAMVQGDRRLLAVLMQNLLDNAWKFTSKHPRARIEFGVADREGERVYYVRDDGAGFDMARADKLFAPFQRLHAASDFPGTGVGLATVRRIVVRHGGRIWAEAAPEQGATFYFTLGFVPGSASDATSGSTP